MISKTGLRGLLAALAVGLWLVVHSPRATAVQNPARQAVKCPIRSALNSFASSSTSMFCFNVRTADAQITASASTPGFGMGPSVSLRGPTVARRRRPALFVSSVEATTAATAAPMDDSAEAEDKAAKDAKRKQTAAQTLTVFVLGLSHHNAAVEVREKLAVPQDDWISAAQELVEYSNGTISEAAVLSTCNRFEVYFTAADGRSAMRAAASFLAERSSLPQGVLRRNLFMLEGTDASWHLLRVSAGLDSLVVGEGQILSQVTACHQAAIAEGGQGGKVLSRMLEQAVIAGKRVRSETSISRGAVSISSAAVEFAQTKAPKVLNKEFKESSVVIVGAGKMSRLLITHLKSHGITKIVLVNRSVGPGSRAAELAEEYPDLEWDLRTMDHMLASIAETDVAFMSTASEVPILLEKDLTDARGLSKPLMVVDISVPRNVELEVEHCPGVSSFNVDHLKEVVARNTAARRLEIIEAEELLVKEQRNFHGWHQSLGAVPTINKLQERVESMRAEEFSKSSKKLKGLSEKELDAVDRLSRGIVNKLLHGPMAHLRAHEGPEDKKRTLQTLISAFKLDEEGQARGKGKGKK